jgi:hypothetical protein
MVAENNRHLHRNVTGFLLIFGRICSKVSTYFFNRENPIRRRELQYFKKGA